MQGDTTAAMTHIHSLSVTNRFDQVHKLQTQQAGCSQCPAPRMSCLQYRSYSAKSLSCPDETTAAKQNFPNVFFNLFPLTLFRAASAMMGQAAGAAQKHEASLLEVRNSSSLSLIVPLFCFQIFSRHMS